MTSRWTTICMATTLLLCASPVTAHADRLTAAMPALATGAIPPPGQVLWTANGTRPLSDEWAEYSTGIDCAVDSTGINDPEIFQESSVVAPYTRGHAYEANVSQSDPLCYSGNRAELGEGLPERGIRTIGSGGFSASRYFLPGRDYWVSFWMRLGSNFPINDANWANVAQFKFLPGAFATYPVALLQVFSGHLWWVDGNTSQYWDLGAVTTSMWMKITVHFLVSSDPSVGYVEVYGSLNGGAEEQLMAHTNVATTAVCAALCSEYGLTVGDDMPITSRIGIYRNPTIPGSATDYFDGYTVATTRDAAEASAFGS